jgi:hypothetical protein
MVTLEALAQLRASGALDRVVWLVLSDGEIEAELKAQCSRPRARRRGALGGPRRAANELPRYYAARTCSCTPTARSTTTTSRASAWCFSRRARRAWPVIGGRSGGVVDAVEDRPGRKTTQLKRDDPAPRAGLPHGGPQRPQREGGRGGRLRGHLGQRPLDLRGPRRARPQRGELDAGARGRGVHGRRHDGPDPPRRRHGLRRLQHDAQRVIRKLEQRGVAGVCIEDKIFPKTNSFIRGAAQPLAAIDEFAGKIKAGKDAQPTTISSSSRASRPSSRAGASRRP